jgi:hypothetical protein
MVVGSGSLRGARIRREDDLAGVQASVRGEIRERQRGRERNEDGNSLLRQRNTGELKRILKVEGVKDRAHAAKIAKRLRAVHADKAKLLGVENYGLTYTAHEIEMERNLLGSPRRYSTGTRTVTIPEKE